MLAAPAIVHAGNLMPVKAWRDPHEAMMELLFRRIADAEKAMAEAMSDTLYGGRSWVRYTGYDILNIKPEDVYTAGNYPIRQSAVAVTFDAR